MINKTKLPMYQIVKQIGQDDPTIAYAWTIEDANYYKSIFEEEQWASVIIYIRPNFIKDTIDTEW